MFMVRRSKKKRSSREDYMLREQLKIEEGVFDERTMIRMGKLFAKGIIARLGFVISTGKEADVYYAEGGKTVREKPVAVKIFRVETSNFERRMNYMVGDPRFGKVKGNVYAIVNEWCKKEFGNLKIAQVAKVHAPKPYAFNGNVLAIEFIDDKGEPARPLRQETLEDPEKVLKVILADIKKLYANDLVHGDVSEYNILMSNGTPYIIDFGQAVVLRHPKSEEFLERDVSNILGYFSKQYGIVRDVVETVGWIKEAAPGQGKD